MVNFDYTYSLVSDEINNYNDDIKMVHNHLHKENKCDGDYLGWVTYPSDFDKEELEKIKKCAAKVKNICDVFLVIGVGGSYLGSRACIEMLTNEFKKDIQIYFVGNNLSSKYMHDLFEYIKDKNICVNVISKSGSTTEIAIAFRIIEQMMSKRYSHDELKERIYITTDKCIGNLRKYANKMGYNTFSIPTDIGGRYSVLTSVGLFPMAVAGIDIDSILNGAKDAYMRYLNDDLSQNDCYKYAVLRNILYERDKNIEVLIGYEPCLSYFGEWFKQLFAESEGKCLKGIFPSYMTYTTDLHSMGQYIQDGRANIFETTLNILNPKYDLKVPNKDDDIDGLSYIEGKTIDFINKKSCEATIKAHVDANVSNLIINIDKLDEYNVGYLIYFFMKACATSAMILGVNPFDQPGVEKYKNNMFELLGK